MFDVAVAAVEEHTTTTTTKMCGRLDFKTGSMRSNEQTRKLVVKIGYNMLFITVVLF